MSRVLYCLVCAACLRRRLRGATGLPWDAGVQQQDPRKSIDDTNGLVCSYTFGSKPQHGSRVVLPDRHFCGALKDDHTLVLGCAPPRLVSLRLPPSWRKRTALFSLHNQGSLLVCCAGTLRIRANEKAVKNI